MKRENGSEYFQLTSSSKVPVKNSLDSPSRVTMLVRRNKVPSVYNSDVVRIDCIHIEREIGRSQINKTFLKENL